MMTSLLDLPADILQQILSILMSCHQASDVYSLNTLSKTCRAIKSYAQPALYGDLWFFHNIFLLLRTLSEAPHLGTLVYKINTCHWSRKRPNMFDERGRPLKRANKIAAKFGINQPQYPLKADHFPVHKGFRMAEMDNFAALVLQLCPNVRQFIYQIKWAIPFIMRPTPLDRLVDLNIYNKDYPDTWLL